MAFVAAKCTQCGGSLQVDASKDAGICPYCGTAYVTEKVIQNYNFQITNNIGTVIVENSEKNKIIEQCRAYLQMKQHHDAWLKATEGIQKYPNVLFFYVCLLYITMQDSDGSIHWGGLVTFESNLNTATKLMANAGTWEKQVISDARKYIANDKLYVKYNGMTDYYMAVYRMNYADANKRAKRKKLGKDIASSIKNVFFRVRSIFLFWLPLVIVVALCIAGNWADSKGYEADDLPSFVFYGGMALIVVSAILVIGNIGALIIFIREKRSQGENPVYVRIADYRQNKRIY